jgi:hypothetical protein
MPGGAVAPQASMLIASGEPGASDCPLRPSVRQKGSS